MSELAQAKSQNASEEVPLSVSYTLPAIHGDPEGRMRAAKEREDAIRLQAVRYLIMPGASVTIASGEILRGGAELTLEQLSGDRHGLQQLIRVGVVHEIDAATAAARRPREGQRYQVGPKAIIGNGRILEPGEWITLNDLPTQAAEPAREFKPAHLDAYGRLEPALDAAPERPAITAEQTAARLVERGLLFDSLASPREANAPNGAVEKPQKTAKVL